MSPVERLSPRVRRYRAALGHRHRAQTVYERKVADIFRPGMPITYRHGDNHIDVTIVRVSVDQLEVRNERTGKEYWIGAYMVVSA